MTGRPSAAMEKAMRLIRNGMTPYGAAKKVGIALSTMYRSALYKKHRDEQQQQLKTPKK